MFEQENMTGKEFTILIMWAICLIGLVVFVFSNVNSEKIRFSDKKGKFVTQEQLSDKLREVEKDLRYLKRICN